MIIMSSNIKGLGKPTKTIAKDIVNSSSTSDYTN